jgi:hypothetical protein
VARIGGRVLVFGLIGSSVAYAAGDYYAGGIAGLAMLSADARSVVGPDESQVSL